VRQQASMKRVGKPTEGETIMENTKSYFDAWHKAQESLFDGFIENTKRTQQLFLGTQAPAFGGGAGGFNNLYTTWANAVLDSLGGSANSDTRVLKDNLSKLLGGSNAYQKLYQLWLPLMKAAQEKSLNPDAYQAFVNPSQYKDLIDKVFGFEPEAITLMLDQASRLLELVTASGQQFSKPWNDAAKSGLAAFPQFAEGHPESFINVFHSLFNAFDNTVGRTFHVPPVGKDREKIELLLRGFDDLSVYAAKNAEYQHVMYLTALTALEKVIETLAEKIRSGEEIKKFDEFFDIWIDVSEQAYFKLFQTEEFAKLQGELLDTGLNVKAHFFKITEMQLEDYPVVLRSEMDDLYKTVYDLKKKVKTLEKQLKETGQ
jgi:class III poly(R)-hydroxyalkanoic acid synthase PhaE subunit